jgi:hypothetical protein
VAMTVPVIVTVPVTVRDRHRTGLAERFVETKHRYAEHERSFMQLALRYYIMGSSPPATHPGTGST